MTPMNLALQCWSLEDLWEGKENFGSIMTVGKSIHRRLWLWDQVRLVQTLGTDGTDNCCCIVHHRPSWLTCGSSFPTNGEDGGGGFFLIYENWGEMFWRIIVRLRSLFVCFTWRSDRAHQFLDSLGQDQSTVARWAETTVAERSLACSNTRHVQFSLHFSKRMIFTSCVNKPICDLFIDGLSS